MALFKKFTVLTFLAIFALTVSSYCGWFDDGFASSGYSAGGGEYLKLPVQAQCAGFGAAAVAWRDNLAGSQYNPSILDAADSITLIGATSFMTFDRRHFGFDAASPVGEYLVAGLSFSQFGDQ